MSLRCILGPAASGKTRRCLDEITAAFPTGKTLVYLVPEQFSLQSELELAELAGKAVTRAQVLSFNRLSYRVFNEAGFPGIKVLDECGKSMLLRKIAHSLRDDLSVFARSTDKQGFIDNLGLIITELYRYGLTAQRLRDSLPGLSGALKHKTQDIALILEHYADQVGRGYLSTDTGLTHLAERIHLSSYVAGSLIWIDGFHGSPRRSTPSSRA